MKNRKKMILKTIILLVILIIAIFVITLNLNISMKSIANSYLEYTSNISEYTDEFNPSFEVYFLDQKNQKACKVVNNEITEYGFEELDSKITSNLGLYDLVVEPNKAIIFNYSKITNQQTKGYLIFVISQVLEYMICDKYNIILESMESIFEEKIGPRFAYSELTRYLEYYIDKDYDTYLGNASYYYDLFSGTNETYNDPDYSKNYKTLNVRGYCQYITYLSIRVGDKKRALDDLVSYYSYYKSYYGEVIPKFLEGDYAPAFVLFLMNDSFRTVDLDTSYLEIFFKDIAPIKIEDDLNLLNIIKDYYQDLYDVQVELVESVEEKLESSVYYKIIINNPNITTNQIKNYVTVNDSKFGGFVQLLEASIDVKVDENSYINVKNQDMIITKDTSKITIFVLFENDINNYINNGVLNYTIENVEIRNLRVTVNMESKELIVVA